MGDRITIELKLPMATDKVHRVLNVLAEIWPSCKVDLEGDEGWLIEVGPDE